MLEYALISATVVLAFAGASQLGLSDVFVTQLTTADSAYNMELPDSLSLNEIGNSISNFNHEITYR
jgi:hypothetical protein